MEAETDSAIAQTIMPRWVDIPLPGLLVLFCGWQTKTLACLWFRSACFLFTMLHIYGFTIEHYFRVNSWLRPHPPPVMLLSGGEITRDTRVYKSVYESVLDMQHNSCVYDAYTHLWIGD